MINNIINFLTHNITLSVGFLLAIIVYILFEVVSWLSSDSLENQSKVNVNQLTSLFNHENALILDLRSAENYNASYIINSVNILPVDCNNQNTLISPINGTERLNFHYTEIISKMKFYKHIDLILSNILREYAVLILKTIESVTKNKIIDIQYDLPENLHFYELESYSNEILGKIFL